MASLRIHEGADEDFAEAYAWYAERDQGVAERFERQVEDGLEQIKDDPTGRATYDGRHCFVRVKGFPHLIIYRRDGIVVWVVAIAHPSRDQSYWQGRSL